VGQLDASLALRYDRYDDQSDVGGATTPQFGLTWRPTEALLWRLSAGHSFRAPDLHRMYAGISRSFSDTTLKLDPAFPVNEVDRYESISAGNIALTEEKGRFINLGLVADLTLTHNGQQLLVAADNQLLSIDLTNAEWPVSPLYQRNNPQCGLFFASLAALNDNKVAIASQFSSCSAKSPVIVYDLDRKKLFGEYMMMAPKVAAAADGSRFIMAEHGVSPVSSVIVIDSLSYQTVPTTLQAAPLSVQLSQDGSRVLLDQRQVYDGSLKPIGTLGQIDAAGYRAHLSADGKHAYVLKTNSAPPL
jgi:hypothetical protein